MKNQLLAQTCKTALIFCRRHKSTILSCVSAAGVVATGVLSARGGIKAEKILAGRKNDISIAEPSLYEGGDVFNAALVESFRKRHPHTELSDEAIVAKCLKRAANIDALKRLIPALLPPVLTAAGTIALIFVTDAQNRQAQAALAGAYAMMAKKLADFREAVRNVTGQEVVDEADKLMAQDNFCEQANDILAEERAEDAKLWYDSYSERYFWATAEEVANTEYYANRIFRLQGYLTLNEFYRLLHFEDDPKLCGDELGWDEYIGEVCYGYTWIYFMHFPREKTDTMPAYTELFFPFQPHPFYEEAIEMEKEYEELCGSVRKYGTHRELEEAEAFVEGLQRGIAE